MVLGKRVAIFNLEWSQNLAPREGKKIPWPAYEILEHTCMLQVICESSKEPAHRQIYSFHFSPGTK